MFMTSRGWRSSEAMSDSPAFRVGIIIPARFASTRYPAKPLARIRGAGGQERSLIERSWIAALAVPGVERVVIATDDTRIAAEVQRFGGDCVMTPAECANGTERCAAALEALGETFDVIINLQGDALLTPADVAVTVIEAMRQDPDLPVATPALRCSRSLYAHLVEDQQAGRVGGTTVVTNHRSDALYFSKRVLPYIAPEVLDAAPGDAVPAWLHLGLYAYRPEALAAYRRMRPCAIEQLEGLEQLRFLHYGVRMAVVDCPPPGWDVIELNNPTDVPRIEAILQQRGLD